MITIVLDMVDKMLGKQHKCSVLEDKYDVTMSSRMDFHAASKIIVTKIIKIANIYFLLLSQKVSIQDAKQNYN